MSTEADRGGKLRGEYLGAERLIFEQYTKGDEVEVTVEGGSWRAVGMVEDI